MAIDYSTTLNFADFCKTLTIYHITPPMGRGDETYTRYVLHNCYWERSETLYIGRGPNGNICKYPTKKRRLIFYIHARDLALQTGNECFRLPFKLGDFVTLGETPVVTSVSELSPYRDSIYFDLGLFRVHGITLFSNYNSSITDLFAIECV